jgi:Zn-dependent peptidase ImmA (M78 family)/transcriptional regulator with XRE-family HTH domain
MASVESVNTERIKWCLHDRGITLDQLAVESGIDLNKLEAVLRGHAELTVGQLKAIARVFQRGLLFFMSKGDVKEEKLRTAGFRTLSNQHPELHGDVKALMERVEHQRQILLNLREELGEVSGPAFRPPDVSSDSPKVAASTARRWLSLNGELSFADYRDAVEAKGILVFVSNGYIGAWRVPPDSEIAGFSIYHRSYPLIFVRKEEFQQRQVFTLAHELAHLLIHGTGSIDVFQDMYGATGKERVANAFAGNLLVPDDSLALIDGNNKPGSASEFERWLRPFAEARGISVEVVLRRLLDAGRLSQHEYRSYREWKAEQKLPERSGGSRKNRYREPLNMFGKPFVGTVLEALGARQLTATKASRFLDNIKITDIHRLERDFNAF